MGKTRLIFFDNRIFFIGYLLFLAFCLTFLAAYSKTEGFIRMNPVHGTALDWFFVYYTNLGDGLFSIAVFGLLLYLRRPLPAWEIVFGFLLSGLLVQVLKNIFPMPRPKTLIGEAHYAHFIDGITHVGNASFPSGHTASAFCLATLLSIFTKNKQWQWLYLMGAILVGYSRVFLGQHFLQDVVAGAILGMISALVVYFVIDSRKNWLKKMKARELALTPNP